MPKHATPKQKLSTIRTKHRYGSFKRKVLTKLSKLISLADCKNCGAKKRNHHVCAECGQYRGKQVISKEKKIDKITTIKA